MLPNFFITISKDSPKTLLSKTFKNTTQSVWCFYYATILKMKKDFTHWHTEKNEVQNNKERPYFHERQIWFCIMGENIGYEQDGRGEKFLRPVIVLRKFNNEVLWVIPLTTKTKKGKYYFSFQFEDSTESTAILSQLRLLDAKRLQYRIGNISIKDFRILKEKIRQLLV